MGLEAEDRLLGALVEVLGPEYGASGRWRVLVDRWLCLTVVEELVDPLQLGKVLTKDILVARIDVLVDDLTRLVGG